MGPERITRLPALPRRRPESHKGDFGHALLLAGGRGMAGAAALAGVSALRSGAGLARVACPAEVQPTVASFEPSYMTYPLAHDAQGRLTLVPNRETLDDLLAAATSVAVGPGLGRGGDIPELVRWLIARVECPLLLDADALNALAETGLDSLASRCGPTVLTPHPGEFARLLGRSVAEVQADREALALELAARHERLVVVLKGAGTVVTDARRIHVNATGNPGMATGGSGDVLTGIIVGLLAQGLDPFDAAALGVHVHGLAGDIARDQNGIVGMIAGDLVDALPDAFYHLDAAEGD